MCRPCHGRPYIPSCGARRAHLGGTNATPPMGGTASGVPTTHCPRTGGKWEGGENLLDRFAVIPAALYAVQERVYEYFYFYIVGNVVWFWRGLNINPML